MCHTALKKTSMMVISSFFFANVSVFTELGEEGELSLSLHFLPSPAGNTLLHKTFQPSLILFPLLLGIAAMVVATMYYGS